MWWWSLVFAAKQTFTPLVQFVDRAEPQTSRGWEAPHQEDYENGLKECVRAA